MNAGWAVSAAGTEEKKQYQCVWEPWPAYSSSGLHSEEAFFPQSPASLLLCSEDREKAGLIEEIAPKEILFIYFLKHNGKKNKKQTPFPPAPFSLVVSAPLANSFWLPLA